MNPGELVVTPKSRKYRPFADEETWMMVLESSEIKHTGDVSTEKTLKEFQEI